MFLDGQEKRDLPNAVEISYPYSMFLSTLTFDEKWGINVKRKKIVLLGLVCCLSIAAISIWITQIGGRQDERPSTLEWLSKDRSSAEKPFSAGDGQDMRDEEVQSSDDLRPRVRIDTFYVTVDIPYPAFSYPVTGQAITVIGDSLTVDLTFDSPISQEEIWKEIRLIGYTGPEPEFSEIRIGEIVQKEYEKLEYGKVYTLLIPRTIHDKKGRTLKEEIRVPITVQSYPKVMFRLVGEEKTYPAVVFYQLDEPGAYGYMRLTSRPKTFIAEFAKPVNRKSVEQALRIAAHPWDDTVPDDEFDEPQELSEPSIPVRYTLRWLSDQQLQIRTGAFPAGICKNTITLNGAIDQEGIAVPGAMVFTTAEANQIRAIHLDSRQDTLIKEFKDELYHVWPNPDITDYFIIGIHDSQIYNCREDSSIDWPFHPAKRS